MDDHPNSRAGSRRRDRLHVRALLGFCICCNRKIAHLQLYSSRGNRMNDFLRSCGFALVLGGIMLILINTLLTPTYLASFKHGEAVARASGIYLLRISMALID